MAKRNKMTITTQQVISTWTWTRKPPILQQKCWPTSTLNILYNPFNVLMKYDRTFIFVL
jgi:hypothetical protein